MICEFIFRVQDESFDFGDFPGGTCPVVTEHGFQIEIGSNDTVYIETLKPIGDFGNEIKGIKTLEQLKEFIVKHLDEVQDENEKERIMELASFIDDNINGYNKSESELEQAEFENWCELGISSAMEDDI